MTQFSTLLDLVCGKPLSAEDSGRSRRLGIAVSALLTSLVFAAIWGVAAGSRPPALAIANLYKLPMVILLSSVGVLLAEPLDRRGDALRLVAPLASGDAVQIVELTGADDLRFEPGAATQLERRVGFFAPAELPSAARDACDRAVRYVRLRTIDDPMYVQVTPQIVADQGLRGSLSTRAERGRSGAIGVAAVFLGLLVALVLLQRKLAQAARIEHAEPSLAAEFAKLDDPDA